MTDGTDRKKLLVHLRRISSLLDGAIRNGPDGTLEGKYAEEHPMFTHYACSIYLIGTLAYLTGEDGEYSWNVRSDIYADFDQYSAAHPEGRDWTFRSRGITQANLDALAQVRNAVVHHDGNLAKNYNENSLDMVIAANIPGVRLNESVVTLEHPNLEHIRIVALAVRGYFGEG